MSQTVTASDTAAWTQRLAQGRWRTREAIQTPARSGDELWIPAAMEALWTLFDTAIEQANDALEQAGLADRITGRRTAQEYRVTMEEPSEEQRHIIAFASLQAVHGHASGGVLITTSATRAAIHLLPTCDKGLPRWIVAATQEEFTADDLNDLFLVSFGDDATATTRLCGLFSLESFT